MTVRSISSLFGGPSNGTEYNLEDACKYCGTGAKRVGPMIFDVRSPAKSALFATLDREFIVKKELADEIRGKGIDCTEEVIFKKTGETIPFEIITPQAILPPFSKTTRGYKREDQCKHCGRDGYFDKIDEPLELRYENLPDILLEKDVLCTYECFGNSGLREPFKDSVFAAPKHVVSDRIKDIVQKWKTRDVRFEPVFI